MTLTSVYIAQGDVASHIAVAMRAKDIGRATEGELQHEVVRLRWELVRWRRLAGRLRRALSARRAAARSGTFRLELPVRGRLSA